MRNQESILKARVTGVNRAHVYASQLSVTLSEIFRPLVEQKLFKVDGTLLEKYKKLLPEFPNTVSLHVYKHTSDYSLAWGVKTCEEVEGIAYYYEVIVYVGNMLNGVLVDISAPFKGRTDYTPEEITTKRETYCQAKKACDDAQSALYPFGEYDR